MARGEQKSLFRRLTRLFRSGPVVKRKIRALDTSIAVADKSKSSGTLLFQKSVSPTYATITSNAYNLSERLMRYQDFQEMEYSLAKSTLIATPDGFKTIGDLADECAADPDKTFIVYAYDHNAKRIVPAWGKQARQTCVDHAWKVTFENGQSITASPEHRLMLRDGSYRRVEDLKPGDSMMPFYRKDLFENAESGTKGYRWVYTMDDRFWGWTKEHQLIAEWVAGRQLEEDEVVHHVNFVKVDNRPENLRIMRKVDHDSYHAALNNGVKWAPENNEWVEEFKRRHAAWMRDNAPTARHDVTFPRIVEAAERVGFSMPALASALDASWTLILERLVANGFANFNQFVQAYASGQAETLVERGKPGLLTRDLSLELLRRTMLHDDTKRSLCIKLGCTVNVLDKFLARRAMVSWSELRASMGFVDSTVVTRARKSARNGGRPRSADGNPLTFQQICEAYAPGLTLPRLSERLGTNKNTVISRLAQNGYQKYSEFGAAFANHKVVSVEYAGVVPLYDLTVDGYKNFATDSVVSHNTPEIAAALDIYADETCSQDEKGEILHVYSENERIKELLEDLFVNVLNVEFNMRSWVRNLPVRRGTVIPLLDGRDVPIEQVAEEVSQGREAWVYSVQDGTHRTVPGRVAWCGLTRRAAGLVRVHLDDGTHVDCTPDHEWVLRDGRHCRADELQPDQSMMPFYRKLSSQEGGDRIEGYEQAYDAMTGKYVYTHQLVASDVCIDKGTVVGSRVIHHVDFDKRNNRPDNLREMEWHDHSRLHADHAERILLTPEVQARRRAVADAWLRSDRHRKMAKEQMAARKARGEMPSWSAYNATPLHKEHNARRREAMKERWQHEPTKARWKAGLAIKFDDRAVDLLVGRLEAHGKYVAPARLGNMLKEDEAFMGHLRAINPGSQRDLTRCLSSATGIGSLLSKAGVGSYLELVQARLPGIAATPWFKRALGKSERLRGQVPAMRAHRGNPVAGVPARLNHKVARVERLQDVDDVYCMEVLGPKGEHDRHRFMTLTSTVNCNGASSGICSANCKYGDMFLFNDVSPEYGVVNVFPIPVNEVEREENYDRTDPFAVRFRWVSLGNRTLENWEVTHFRLLGNDMFLPYGSSIIEPARRIWRQLILIEDAMLVYRVVRAPERRVFYIDVANIPPNEVPLYVEEQRANLRTAPVADRTTGRVDLRYNPMCISMSTRIKLQDGRDLSLEELISEWDAGKRDQWVYSIDPKTLRYVPGRVSWAGVTRRDAELVRVHIDDGTWRDVTPDHRFMLRDGSYQRADELQAGQALMPLNVRISSREDGDDIVGYEKVYDPATGTYVLTHRRNANAVHADQREHVRSMTDWSVNNNLTVHHVDYNKRNNDPSNLRWMGNVDHVRMHAANGRANLIRWNKSEKKKLRVSQLNHERNSVAAMRHYNGSALHASHNPQRREAQLKKWADPERRAAAQQNMRYALTDVMFERLMDIVSCNPKLGRARIHALLMQDAAFVGSLQQQPTQRDISRYSHAAWEGELKRRGYEGLSGLRRNIVGYQNHKVAHVERLARREDTGCINVDEWHNFAAGPNKLDSVVASNSWILLHNSIEEDYFIPIRGQDSGTKIDTLAGGQNAAAVEDVAYIQKKMFAALKVPRAYLGYDEMLSSKATLAQEDIRFSRTINVIQKTVLAELNKLAIIHLYAHGYDNEDLQNFTLRLSNPSTVAQQQKLELWRARFEIAGSAPEGMGSKRFIRKEIWGLNDERIEEIDDERLRERMVDAAIEDAVAGEGGAEGGDDDLFGAGEEPAGPSGDEGGDEPAGEAGEEPPEENAALDPEELAAPTAGLLTSDDDRGDVATLPLPGDRPVRVSNQLDRALYNRARRRHHGASSTHMPDFERMTSHDGPGMDDPFDAGWMRSIASNPLGEGMPARRPGRLPPDVASTLRRMTSMFDQRAAPRDGVIAEGIDVQDEVDAPGLLAVDDDGGALVNEGVVTHDEEG